MWETFSPSGRYEITLYEHEAFNTHWVQTPGIQDTQTGSSVWAPTNTQWSLDSGEWLDDARVRLVVRKYPGNHRPGDIRIVIDCAARTGSVGEGLAVPLPELEAGMDQALTWIHAPPDPPPPNFLARLQRWLRRL